MKLKRTALAALAAGALVLTGCTSGPSEGGAVLRIGTSSGIDSMNPFVGIQQDAYSAWMQIYPSLMQYDTTRDDMAYMPSLAEEWHVSDDGLVITFNIRDGATWSDGETLDAEDVAWSFNLFHEYRDTAAAGWGIGGNITSIVAEDPRTLVVTHEAPSALSLYQLGTTPIVPEQDWGEHADSEEALRAFENVPVNGESPVAGGPFMLTEYRQAEVAVFQKNPNWYGNEPSISGFGLQTFRVDDAMVTALTSGNLDAIFGVPPTAVGALEGAGATVASQPALILRDLLINSNPDKPDNRELLNPNVRKALEHAINRTEIVETAWVGSAVPGDSVLPPSTSTQGVMWYNQDLETIGYDLDEANRLLDEEGFERGADGVRLADDGSRMEYDLIFADDESGPGDRAFQIMKTDFEKIGIVINQRKLDSSATWDAIYCDEDCEYRDFDLAMWDWYPAPDPNFLMSAMTCEQWGSWNDVGYCDAEFDALNEQQRMEINPVERKRIIDEMQQKLYDDRPYIILTYDVQIDAWASNWSGLVPAAQGFFNNWSTQSLEQAVRK